MKTITTVLKWRQESTVLLRFSCRVQCLLFMSALGRSIDDDSAALKSHFFKAFGNLLKDEDTSQKASQIINILECI
jgi:hypothetical protein